MCAAALVTVLGCYVGLGMVAAVSWRRTASIRKGALPPGPCPHTDSGILRRTSPTTFLAAGAGAAIAAAGWTCAHLAYPVRAGLVSAGAAVCVAGLARRVRGIVARPEDLVVMFATGPTASLAWEEGRSLRPPRRPWSGWTFVGERRRITLMPSDLLGGETVLELAIDRAGLVYDGRTWVRSPRGSRSSGPGGRRTGSNRSREGEPRRSTRRSPQAR